MGHNPRPSAILLAIQSHIWDNIYMELVSKKEVEYRQDTEGTPCSSCANYITPEKCSVVDGKVAANGTCNVFLDKSADSAGVNEMLFGGASGGLDE